LASLALASLIASIAAGSPRFTTTSPADSSGARSAASACGPFSCGPGCWW
jgi:hypothetical protein